MKKQIFLMLIVFMFSLKAFSFDNYYKMLGISENATQEEIKKGYRRMAMKYHPDKHSGSVVANEIFKKVQGAYEVLSDPKQRVIFDKQLSKQAKVKKAPEEQTKAKTDSASTRPNGDNARKYTWENFDQKEEAPKAQAKPEAPKAYTYEFKPKPAPQAEAAMTNTEKAFKGDTSVAKPTVEARTPFKNPKLDIYKATRCSTGFLGTVIDTFN
jgi:DnaJ-class molecular chaperone